MEQRIYHGSLDPQDLARTLLDEWDREETIAQALAAEDQMIVQIGQREGGWFSDEPRQAITLGIEPIDGGVRVAMGQQQWYKEQSIQIIGGGLIGFFPFFFAWPLGQLFGGDDEEIDQRLPGRIWQSVERYAASAGAATGPTHRLAMRTCPTCGVANPQGAERCSACGTQLARVPACPRCGQSNPPGANFCIQCGAQLAPTARAVGG
jgi:ribosomal protein L40E